MSTIKRTQIAQAAFDFAGFFQATFGGIPVGTAVPRRPTLVAPQEMSTAGGKKAKQHIVLQPQNPAASALTIGWLDLSNGAANLRTYGRLHQLHAQRFGRQPFDLEPESYQAFFNGAHQFFSKQGIRVEVEEPEGGAAGAVEVKAQAGGNNTLYIILGVVAVLGILGLGAAGWMYINYLR